MPDADDPISRMLSIAKMMETKLADDPRGPGYGELYDINQALADIRKLIAVASPPTPRP